jgi:hypothetical protein
MRTWRVAVWLMVSAAPVAAQHGGGAAAAAIPAVPKEASQFDFLVGQWDLTVKVPAPSLAVRIHGGMPKLLGTWRGWRGLDGFGIEDELRITDAAGNPKGFGHAVRYFDPGARRWTTMGLDVYRGRTTAGSAEWKGTEMTATANGTDADGKPSLSRSRWYDITPTGFKYQQDRSTDGGKTWTEGALRIEARRAAPSPR